MKLVPIYRLEEHHEAYIAWWDCQRTTRAASHHLIHIDEHADFGMPMLNRALPVGPYALLADVLAFTYHQLTVGTFLIPAYLAGFFSHLSWVRPSLARKRPAEHLSFTALDQQPFISKQTAKENNAGLVYQQVGWKDIDFIDTPWLLDICLDAFACEPYPNSSHLNLEISETQYKIFQKFALNSWHARYGGNFKFWESNGCFFVCIQEDIQSSNSINDESIWNQAMLRLSKFKRFMRHIQRPPELVTLSRSVRSGYTPKRLANKLEIAIVDVIRSAIPNLDDRDLPNA